MARQPFLANLLPDGSPLFLIWNLFQDAATGLLYVGNGQYYDPLTGRFLSRDAKPNNSNPYSPFDPIGALFAPLGLLSIYYSRKKKIGKWGIWLALMIIAGSVGMSLSACNFSVTFTPTSMPVPGWNATVTFDNGYTATAFIQASTGSPAAPPAYPCPEPETPAPPTPSPRRFEKIIFICGVGDGSACADGGAPLNPFRKWAERIGYTNSDFNIYDVDVCGSKLTCANNAQSNFNSNNSSRFLLIGHSAGGDAVVVAGDRVADKGRIAGIVLLDPTLTATLENDIPPAFTDLQGMADNLPKPKFVGESDPIIGDQIDVKIAGSVERQFPDYNHEDLALREEVVTEMVSAFGWSEMK